jgi:prepilin-type N-terminal cleavage/methylation domain-containing protein
MYKRYSSGFTLIETLLAVIIVGVLAAIAAPSWVSFINQRRVNAVNDAIARALQSAQREAKKNKLSYSVRFTNNATEKVPKIAIYRSGNFSESSWVSLGKDLGIQAGQIILLTNLSGENSAANSLPSYASANSSATTTITFDYRGNLQFNTNLGNQGLIISVAVPQSAAPTQAVISSMRCVKIKTLLGALQSSSGNQCNVQ